MYSSLNGIRKQFRDELSGEYSDRIANQLFYRLLESFFGIKKTDAVLAPDKELPAAQRDELYDALKRLTEKEPVQYIDNTAYFMDDAFYVDHSVLIPRPETEELVQLILNQHNQHALKVLDIGTGSGAIAVNLAKHRNNWSIYACDVSNEALVVARRNGRELLKNTEVAFYQEDILQPKSFYTSGLDVIVSNPPYVLEADKSDMQEQVLKHEPHAALFVSNDNPLLFYNAIVKYASDNLKQSGALYFEVHELYADKVAQLLSASDYLNVKVCDDLQGKPRIVSGLK